MTVALQVNALLAAEDLRDALGLTSPDQDDAIRGLINRASDECETYCNRLIKARAFIAIRYPGQYGTNLRPRATPLDVAATLTVSLDGTALTVWKSESDGDPALKDVTVGSDVAGEPSFLYRASGWVGATPWPILLTCTAGYATIPGSIKAAALLIGQTFYRHTKGLEPYQSYPAGATGGTVTMRADTIPKTARELLDPFRWVSV